ncbi:hypothetical protein BKA62DRAFT_694278 [Auriculariales sp. MPI-PUGE-AT-0066]|nr:hypothetical protein BKA62DRAFT_694278 [Auriculariales sp. MPI-PUGE-AT-0066]
MSLALPVLRRQPHALQHLLAPLQRWRASIPLTGLPASLHAIPTAFSLGALRLALPSLQSLLELLPPIVWAVPKKKVSHSRKSMREANKGIKDKLNIVSCSACGSPKLAHNICPRCVQELTATWKAEARNAVGGRR